MMEHLFGNPYLDWLTQSDLFGSEPKPKEYDENQLIEVDFKIVSTEATNE